MPPNSEPSSPSKSDSKDNGPWIPSEPLSSGTNTTEDIQLSFQGANIDMIVQWLAQTTGKSVIKHPRAQCQLTITSSKKVSLREAVNLVYRALAMEGYTAIEFPKSILIVPEGQEPRMSAEMVENSKDIPQGRQRLVKVFTLKHLQAADLKERLKSALTDKATVEVDERSNQLIVTDYNDNLRLASELIEALDTDKAEDITIRVLPLKHVSAQDLAKEIEPIYQKMSGKSVGDLVDVAADDRANALIVFSSEAKFRVLEALIEGLDTEDAQEKVMKTFELKNADAQDVAKQLQDLNQDQSFTSRYVYFFGGQSDDKNRKKLSVVADRRRNAVIVQAPPAQMDGIEKMINELDAPVNDDSLAPKIYQLKYVSAADIEDVLNELFLKKQQQRSYWDYFSDEPPQTTDRDVGRLYGKVRITSEPYSNTIIVTSNSKENLAVVEDVLRQLDQPSEAGESTLHVGLKFAKASTVANAINILFAKNGSPPLRGGGQQAQGNNAANTQTQQNNQQNTSSQNNFDLAQETKEDGYYPWLGGQPDNLRGTDSRNTIRPVSDLVGRVRAVADERSNAVLLSANVHFFPQMLKLVDELDAPTEQVLIEARLVEVANNFLDKLGVRFSPDGSKVFTADDYDNSILLHSSGTQNQGIGGKTIVNNPATGSFASTFSPANLLAQMRSGVVASTINIDFLIQFLRETTATTVLAEPQLNIRDNETGRLFVGQQVPIPDNTQVSQLGGQNTTLKYKDVGVVLEVTPHINTAGDVELKVHAESSTVVPGETVLGGAVFDSRAFKTDLTAKNGETLVLGGIIQKEVSDTLRKTPLLGDIPGVGWLFKKRDKSVQDVELMVFLRPRVIRSAEDAQLLLRDVDRKAPRVKQYQEDYQPASPRK